MIADIVLPIERDAGTLGMNAVLFLFGDQQEHFEVFDLLSEVVDLCALQGFRQFGGTRLRGDLHSQGQRLIDQIDAGIGRRRLICADEAPAIDAIQQSRDKVFCVDVRVREIQSSARQDIVLIHRQALADVTDHCLALKHCCASSLAAEPCRHDFWLFNRGWQLCQPSSQLLRGGANTVTCSNVVEAGINAHQNLHCAFNAVRSGQTDSWRRRAATGAAAYPLGADPFGCKTRYSLIWFSGGSPEVPTGNGTGLSRYQSGRLGAGPP